MTEHIQPSTSDEISLKDLILKIKEWVAYLKTQWWKIAIAGILGGLIGFVYAWMQPITYTAKTTFVVEDGKSSGGLSGLASLAGQFGVDMGGGGGGLIAGENILYYFKSESLVREVLLSPWDNTKTFGDFYIEFNGFKKAWSKQLNFEVLKISENKSRIVYQRTIDSLLNILVQKIIKSELQIKKIDKKAGFIELSSIMRDEQFSKRFNEQLVNIAINRYVNLKTQRQKKTVDILQSRVDSLTLLLNQKTGISAALQTQNSTMDMNPIFRTVPTIKSELALREKNMLGSIYIEVVKNLEMAKFTLSQETPVIQIVNNPIYPLEKYKYSKLKAILLFGSILALTQLLLLCVFKWYLNQVKE
ncbi:MAG: hypothetical protein MH132_10200 [Hydrotalea sp.]|nr:hypothetical protein [Hydrotalea sp.]